MISQLPVHHTHKFASSIGLFSLVLGCFLGMGLAGDAALASTATASLALGSQPAGCTFQIIDAQGQIKAQGQTPYVGVLPAGRYQIKLHKDGFFTEQRGLLLKSGEQRILQIELMSAGTASRQAPAARPSPTSQQAPGARQAPTSRPVVSPSQRAVPPAHRVVPVAPRQGPGTTPTAAVEPRPTTTPPARTTTPPVARTTTTPPVARRPEVGPPSRGTVAPAQATPASPRSATAPQQASPNATTINPPGKKTDPKAEKKAKKGRSIPWIPLAAAGGLGIAGAVFWGLSGGSLAASKDLSKFQRDAFQEYQQGRTHRSTAIFLFAAGGAAIGLAALFYFWNPTRNKKKAPVTDNTTPVGQIRIDRHKAPDDAHFRLDTSMPW